MENDIPLYMAVHFANISAVESALGAGANVNGHPDQPYAPIAKAIIRQSTGVVNSLLGHGADPNKPVTVELVSPSGVNVRPILGARALHIAIMIGNVEIIRLLLECPRANPNATDNEGTTPLMTACSRQCISVEPVRLLLEAGADPALEDGKGEIPLHRVAQFDMHDLAEMLHSSAPVTINRCTPDSLTPLFIACSVGQESMVSKLLSLGAMQPGSPQTSGECPLAAAVTNGLVGVVRVLLNEGGIKAVGGKAALISSLAVAIVCRRARILRLLLSADGVKGRPELANTGVEGKSLLHYGASCCYPAAVSTLLEAGADEAAHDFTGRTARDVIYFGVRPGVLIDPGDAVAIPRMLQRGPAYRARSWAWPSDEEAGACGAGDATAGDNDVAVGATSAAAVVRLSPQDVKLTRVIFSTNRSSKVFVRFLARYCAKD